MDAIARTLNLITSCGRRFPSGVTGWVRFSLVGGVTISTNLILLWFLTYHVHIHYIVSAIIAYAVGTSVSYYLNRKWTFSATERTLWSTYCNFFLIATLSIIPIIAGLALLVELFDIPVLIARVLAGAIVGTISYYINAKYNFNTME